MTAAHHANVDQSAPLIRVIHSAYQAASSIVTNFRYPNFISFYEIHISRGRPTHKDPEARRDNVVRMTRSSTARKIVQASWRTVARAGARKFRISDVAAEAGVSVGLVYYHYKSRNGLLHATMEYANELTSPKSTNPKDHENGLAELREALLVDFAPSELRQDNAVVWHELVSAAVFTEDLREQIDLTLQSWNLAIIETLRRGQRDGSIRSDVEPTTLAAALTALSDGLLSRVIVDSLDWSSAAEILNDSIDRLASSSS